MKQRLQSVSDVKQNAWELWLSAKSSCLGLKVLFLLVESLSQMCAIIVMDTIQTKTAIANAIIC